MKRKVKRYYVIRYKWCKTAAVFYFLFLMFSVLTCLMPSLYPLWIFSMIDFLTVISATFYVEVVEKEKESEV